MADDLVRALVASVDFGLAIQRGPLQGPDHVGMILVFTGQLASRLAGSDRFRRKPKLVGRRVPPRFLTIVLPLHRLGELLLYTP